MGSRKEELLEMLKSTLALSKTSLRVAVKKPQQEAATTMDQGLAGRNKDSQPTFMNAACSEASYRATVEEEDEFLYGRTDAGGDRRDGSDAGYRLKKRDELSERYRDHTSWGEKSLADTRGERFDNPNVMDSNSRSSMREFAQNAHASSGLLQSGQHKVTSVQSNSFLENDRFSPACGSDKSSIDSSFDTSKMVDNILKSISMDGDLSKIIAEKLKKSCEDAAAANSQSIAEQNASLIPVRIESNVRPHLAEVRQFSEVYTSPGPTQSATYHHPAAVFPGEQEVFQESKNSSWNRKTAEFLRKLEIPQPLSNYEERNYDNDKKNFDQRKRLSTTSRSSLTKSPSPIKKLKVQQNSKAEEVIDSSRRADEDMFASSFVNESSKTKALRIPDESRRIVMKPDALKLKQPDRVSASRGKGGLEDTGINKGEILGTINALEEEIRRLERRRSIMSSKPSTPQLQANIATNAQMQCEMKSQISTMKQIISEISSPVRNFTREEVVTRDDSSSASAGDVWGRQINKVKQDTKMTDAMPRHDTATKNEERLSAASTSSQRSISKSRNGSEKSEERRSPMKPVKEMPRQRSRSRSRPSDRTRNEKIAIPSAAGIHTSKMDNNIQKKKEALVVAGKQGKDQVKEPHRMIEDKVKMGIEYAVSLYMKAQKFYDSGNLWCQHCDMICSNINEFGKHLHTQDHLLKSGDVITKVLATKSQGQSCGPNSAPARGEEFIKPVQAFYCTLCEELCKDDVGLEAHFTSVAHNKKFQEFLVKNPNYEVPYLAKKMAVILKENPLSKESKASNQTASVEPKTAWTEQVVENRKVTTTKKNDVPLENISITLLRKEPIKKNEGKEIGSEKQTNSSDYRNAGQINRNQASKNLPKTYHVQPFRLAAPKK